MRILAVSTFAFPDHYGGAERVIRVACKGLSARGHDVTLITGRMEGTQARERDGALEVVRYPVDRTSRRAFYRSVWSGVRRMIRDGAGAGAEVLHVHQIASAVPALAPGGGRAAARLMSFYAPYHLEYLTRHREGRDHGRVPASTRVVAKIVRRVDRYVLGRCQEILALSRFSRTQIAEILPVAAKRTTIAPAGVDLERFAPVRDEAERDELVASFGLSDEGGPIVLSVRRLVPRMGLPDLIDACELLQRQGRDTQLVIAGDGPQRAELEQRARALRSATFLGRVAEERLPDLYRAADVFVLPTRSLEGFGMATAEALASGLPVLGTRAGATAELLAEVEGARLVPAGDPSTLAGALAGWVDDSQARLRAGRCARAYAEQALHWDRHLDAIERAAERALAAAR